ncbi:hypothetical protein FACS1894216_02360 [Synergistales bacterium]|nr:hypothetical protein FACS1894216_02360 [Synergistales bacterium]
MNETMRDIKVLEYVRSLFPYDGVQPEELYSTDTLFRSAMESDICQADPAKCVGEKECHWRGYAAKVFREDTFGVPHYSVRAFPCAAARRVHEQKRLQKLIAASRIPSELESCAFESFKPSNSSTANAKRFAEYSAEGGTGLLLEGSPGTGKTHLAVAIVQRVISMGRSAMFIPVVNLLDEMKDAVFFNRIKDMREVLCEVECLALDDLGMQKDTEWVGERLYEIINDRYNAGRQIVMTTNARNMEEIASMIGTSGHQIASRLSQMTAAVMIEAPDYRKKLAKMPKIHEKEAV